MKELKTRERMMDRLRNGVWSCVEHVCGIEPGKQSKRMWTGSSDVILGKSVRGGVSMFQV